MAIPGREEELRTTRALTPVQATAPAGAALATADVAFSGEPALPGVALDTRLQAQAPAATAARYELRGLVGMGATSRVYTAFDRDLAREVAVKVLQPGAEVVDEIASFVDEARITARLSHPNVLPVYELDAGDDGSVFFTMKRIDGRSLGQALESDDAQRGALAAALPGALAGPGGVVSVFVGVCQALAYAHHRGVVHQDVKPDNIMLGGFGEVLLVDWGSAVRMDDPKPRLYGTPLYMSPEQARLEGVDARSDVFAVGASLFHALIGRPPTMADGLEPLMDRRRKGELDAPTRAETRDLPRALLAIALKAMAAQPARRYQTMEAMLADLRAYQDGLAVSAHRDAPWTVLARWYRRNRRLAWVSAAAALLCALTLGAWLQEKAKERTSWKVVHEGVPADEAALAAGWIGTVRSHFDWRRPPYEVAMPARERWRIADGAMVIDGAQNCQALTWKGSLPGDFRVEWTYRGLRTGCNLNCFVGRDRESGYTFHVGGFLSAQLVTLTGRERTLDQRRLDRPLERDRDYRFVMEKDGGTVRLAIDGEVVIEHRGYDPLGEIDASTFGFDTWRNELVAVRDLRVLARPLPQRVSPLEVARAVYRLGHADEAERQYGDIAATYPGTPLASEALFQRAVSALRRGDRARGERELEAFIAAHPAHAQTPMALFELLVAADAALPRDAAAVDTLRERIAAHRGHPILRTVLTEIGVELSADLHPSRVTALGVGGLPPDIVERVQARLSELERQAALFGLPTRDSPLIQLAVTAFCHSGRPELGLPYAVDEGLRFQIARDMGRYDEALALARRGSWDEQHIPEVLLSMGRAEEVATGPFNEFRRAEALYELGRHDELIERFPLSQFANRAMILRRDLERHAERWPLDDSLAADPIPSLTPQFLRLQALRDREGLLRLWPLDDVVRNAAFTLEGRFGEAARALPAVPAASVTCALELYLRGRREEGAGLLEEARRTWNSWRDVTGTVSLHIVLPLLPLLEAGAGDPRPLLRPVLDRRYGAAQRAWHMAALIVGDIDETAFRAQPMRRYLDEARHLALALRAQCRGDRAAAAEHFAAIAALPTPNCILQPRCALLARWCAGGATRAPAHDAPGAAP